MYVVISDRAAVQCYATMEIRWMEKYNNFLPEKLLNSILSMYLEFIHLHILNLASFWFRQNFEGVFSRNC